MLQTTAPTKNQRLLAWVDEMAELTQPDDIHWCDGTAEEYDALVAAGGPYAAQLSTARDLFLATALDDDFADFLTLPAYDEVLRAGG